MQDALDELSIDIAAVRVVHALLQDHQLRTLSLAEWNSSKEQFFRADLPKTLFLMDENFSRESASDKEGLRLIREIFQAAPEENTMCALLSHNYAVAGIHQQWSDLCEQEHLPKSRFVLIPKTLLKDDPVGFARLLKLAVLNSACTALIEMTSQLLASARNKATERLKAIDIYELDQIIFRSSDYEGVWEPDTLFRLFTLFHRDEAKSTAKNDLRLRELTDKIRVVSLIPTDSETAPVYEAWKTQRLEFYEEGDYINPIHLPLEAGDVFQRVGSSSKQYILLAQPCDLMVRNEGKRHYTINEGLLAEINSNAGDKESSAELMYYDPTGEKHFWVDFRRTVTVKLCCLDLVVFQADGSAKLEVGEACPASVIPTWKQRHQILSQELERKSDSYQELIKNNVAHKVAENYIFTISNVKVFNWKFDPKKKAILYDFRRVRRLRQPRAAALLAHYSNYAARQAFEHDFGRTQTRAQQ